MATFTFDNAAPKTVTVAIEPWAVAIELESRGRIVITYDEPANLDVTLDENGSVTVGVAADGVHITAPGFDQRFV